MATLTNEQIEQKKQRLHQLAEEAQAICKELVEAGAIELSEEELGQAAGGTNWLLMARAKERVKNAKRFF
jgi:hypothetical protein